MGKYDILLLENTQRIGMNITLTGKAALVCGSSQGIGKAIAIELAQLGAHVTLLARNASRLEEVRKELETVPGQQHGVLVADFSQPQAVQAVVQQHVDKGHTFQILINNTGGPSGGPLTEALPEAFIQALQMHLICNQLLVQIVLPGMKESGYGRIIQVISSSVKEPIPGLGVSNTTRGAVAAWGKILASELGPFGITVNNLLPGFIQTERLSYVIQSRADKAKVPYEAMAHQLKQTVPMGRFGDPGEIAQVAAFLCTPAASYVSGTNVLVDGGKTKTY